MMKKKTKKMVAPSTKNHEQEKNEMPLRRLKTLKRLKIPVAMNQKKKRMTTLRNQTKILVETMTRASYNGKTH